jgi:hypothetical protein
MTDQQKEAFAMCLRKEGYIVVLEEQFIHYYNESIKFYALVEFGVDNWPGYADAMQSLEDDEDETSSND